VIRRATTDLDHEIIKKIHSEYFAGGQRECPEFHGAWWVFSLDGDVVGFAGIHLSTRYKKTAYLCRVVVVDRFQGRGIHKRLVRVRERWARRNGIQWIITDTYPDNYASINTLINCGYKVWGPSKKLRWAGNKNSIYWMKRL